MPGIWKILSHHALELTPGLTVYRRVQNNLGRGHGKGARRDLKEINQKPHGVEETVLGRQFPPGAVVHTLNATFQMPSANMCTVGGAAHNPFVPRSLQ